MKNEKIKKEKLDKKTQEFLEKFHKGLTWELCFFIVASLLSLCLAYLTIDSLFLTIPFLVLPAFFALLTINTAAIYSTNNDSPSIWNAFRMYFSPFFFGAFRIITSFFKALLTFIVSVAGLGIIAGTAILPLNDEYAAFVDSLSPNIETSDLLNQYQQFMMSNDFFKEVTMFITITSLFAAAVMFIHQISKNAVKVFYNLTTKMPMAVPQLNNVHKEVLFINKKAFFKEYFRSTWFLHLLLLVGLFGGFAINYFAIGNGNIADSFVIGLALALLLVSPFLNYFSYVLTGMYAHFSKDYFESFFKTSFELINKLKSENKINDEESKAIAEAINNAKKEVDESKTSEENKDKKSHE